MSIWKEIKTALNSTFGTNKFKPLDKLILDNRAYVANHDYVVKLLADRVEYEYMRNSPSQSNIPKTIGSFRAEIGGTLFFEFDLDYIGGTVAPITVRVADDMGNYREASFAPEASETIHYSMLIQFEPNKTYTIEISDVSNSSSGELLNCTLNGIATQAKIEEV